MKRYGQRFMPVAVIIGLLLIWEGAVRLFQIPLYVLPSPLQVMKALAEESATLAGHAVITVAEALIGIGILWHWQYFWGL